MATRRRAAAQVAVATAALLVVGALAVVVQSWRAGIPIGDLLGGRPERARATASETAALVETLHAPKIDFLIPAAIGDSVSADDRPLIANVAVADLDRDGLADVLVADATKNRVTWIRQSPAGQFTERTLGDVAGPAHVQAVDLDRDGDLDIVVASLGVLFPNNARIGAVIVLENDGRMASRHASWPTTSRASRTCAPVISMATATSTSPSRSSATTKARRAGWRIAAAGVSSATCCNDCRARSTPRSSMSTPTATTTSCRWSARNGKRSTLFINDGRGRFTPQRIFGASNEDFGSSWISVVDLDRDGDPGRAVQQR